MKILNKEINEGDIVRVRTKRLSCVGWFKKSTKLSKIFKFDFMLISLKGSSGYGIISESFKIKGIKEIEILNRIEKEVKKNE